MTVSEYIASVGRIHDRSKQRACRFALPARGHILHGSDDLHGAPLGVVNHPAQFMDILYRAVIHHDAMFDPLTGSGRKKRCIVLSGYLSVIGMNPRDRRFR